MANYMAFGAPITSHSASGETEKLRADRCLCPSRSLTRKCSPSIMDLLRYIYPGNVNGSSGKGKRVEYDLADGFNIRSIHSI